MEPKYVVRKSVAKTLSIWLILFCWLIIPLIIQVSRILKAVNYRIEFYDNKMVCKSGVLNKKETQAVFMGVYAVSINQSLKGRIFNYGDIRVDCPGKWDIDTTGVKDPAGLKAFLEEHITSNGNVVITN